MGNTASSTIAHSSTTSSGYDLTVQTVFTPPPACTSADISMMQISSDYLWNNAIVPASGTTESSCYPTQFWSSAVATVSLPPFKQLICPSGWGTYNINSTYIICCPGSAHRTRNDPLVTDSEIVDMDCMLQASQSQNGLLQELIVRPGSGRVNCTM